MTTYHKPLLLLDVDGVINDLEAVMKIRPFGSDAQERAAELDVDLIRSHGFWLAIPHTMPDLIQELTAHFETWWCSNWRGQANDEIAKHLGVGPFPVIDDGEGAFGWKWKVDAARPLVEAAVAEDRCVAWIGDFCGDVPELPGVTYIDTGERRALDWAHLGLEAPETAAA